MQSDAFIQLTARLRDLGGRRVWSLIVSLFGDLAQGKGDVIDGPVLTSIMNMLQVRPEAARVALHRLRNDGWIASQKIGRISQHGLTPLGQAESAAASPKIYAQPDDRARDWQLVLLENATPETQTKMARNGFIALTNRIFVGGIDNPAPDHAISLKGQTVPNWLQAQIEPEGLRRDYADLSEALNAIKAEIPRPNDISPLQTAVLRCLIVHNWRRLVLKHPPLPEALTDPDWPEPTCHALVAELLGRFPRPAPRDIAHKKAAT